jgi:nucleoside-diphosphate-sugar epimerase
MPGGKCVVTGGSGFVGRRLVEMLANEGREVVSFDRMPAESAASKRVRHVVGNITQLADVMDVCEGVWRIWHARQAVSATS